MNDKTPLVVIFPRGQLTAKDKERFTKAGILAAEADDPQAVCQLHLTAPLVSTKINGDAIVRAALGALASQPAETAGGYVTNVGRAQEAFVKALFASITEGGNV